MDQLSTDISNLAVANIEDGMPATEYTVASRSMWPYHQSRCTVKLTYEAQDTMFAIRTSPGKGLGIFALRQIPRGTCIFSEQPLVALPAGAKGHEDVHKEFEKLSALQLQHFGSLACNMGVIHPGVEHVVRSRLAHEGKRGAELDEATGEELKLRAIFQTNSVMMGSSGEYGIGVFPTYSRLNHSCIPNVHCSFNPKLGQETIFAVRSIEKGEEILTSYIHLLRTRGQRAAELKQWGINCDCKACKDLQGSERRRKRMFNIDQAFAMYEKNLQSMAAFSRIKLPRSDGEAVALGEELIELLKEEGVVGFDLANA